MYRQQLRADWVRHRDVIVQVPLWAAGHRGCIGLGLLADNIGDWQTVTDPNGGRHLLFAANQDVRFATIADIPAGVFAGVRRESHWSVVRQVTVRYGMPIIGSEGEVHDFRVCLGKARRRSRVRLPEDRIFGLLNGLEWSMTSAAAQFRGPWRVIREKLARVRGVEFDPERPVHFHGREISADNPKPETWLPRPYLRFDRGLLEEILKDSWFRTDSEKRLPAAVTRGFTRTVEAGWPLYAPEAGTCELTHECVDGETWLGVHFQGGSGVQYRWEVPADNMVVPARTHEPVPAGALLVRRRPTKVSRDYDTGCARLKSDLSGAKLGGYLHRWLLNQALPRSTSEFLIPAELAAPAARASTRLVWEMSRCARWFDDAFDGFVFPAIRQDRWDDFRGVLPGEIAYDLTPWPLEVEAGAA